MSSRDLLSAVLAIAVVAAAASLGELATIPNLAPWYAELAKPSFNPPNAVFGPVWSVLYLLMIFAFWRVLRLAPSAPGRPLAMALFLAQLALNVLWTFLFFGAHSPLMGLIEIVVQFLAIVATIVAVWRVDSVAALALVPLAAWVGFASVLNFAIWRMN